MATPRLITEPGVSNPRYLTAVGNTLFFSATDPSNGTTLWKSDGTVAGTVRVADTFNPKYLTTFGNSLFFSATGGGKGRDLWKSDGTAAGTVRVLDLNPGRYTGSYPRNFTTVGTTLFFTAFEDGTGAELWKSDGTGAGTVRVADINPGSRTADPRYITAVGNTLFFSANESNDSTFSQRELWKSDGTAAGTVRVADILPGAYGSAPRNLTTVGNTLFFTADDGTGRELWKSDGTVAGTVRVADIRPGSASPNPYYLTTVGNTLFFTADDGSKGRELWKSDGTVAGTVRVADIRLGILGSDPRNLTAVGNTLFFTADDGKSGRELWKSDGTAAGTVRVADISEAIFGSNLGSYPQFLTAVGNTLFFSADALSLNNPLGSGGRELWKSDGTAAGTVRVADIFPGIPGSNPKYITAVGNTLFFYASGLSFSSRGLWALDLNNTDRTAPRLNAVTVEGNQLLLGFSEAILSPGLTVDRFAVTVGGANRAVTAISAGATSSQLRLTLAGAAPTSSQNVRVRYTDLSIRNDASGVIQDAAGNDMASIPAPGRAADTFRSAASVTALAATTTNLVLTGSAAINGTGNALANTITGNSAANLLNGVAGADQLIGGAGNDTLTGGLGADIFRFNAALSSTTNRDTITDFNPAQGDRIQLENAIFSALTRTGTLAATAFRSGSSFTSSAQRILYNPATGNLSYDSNGSAAGGISALIATLTTRPAMTSSMFVVT